MVSKPDPSSTPHAVATVWTGAIPFDPQTDFAAWIKQLPARWAVVLLSSPQGKPVQLLAVKNVRRLLAERMDPAYTETAGRRIDYRSLVGSVSWIEVGNQLEADWFYLSQARAAFPGTYRGMAGLSPAWFVHLDPEARFPKVAKTIDPTLKEGRLVGPLYDKHTSGRLVEMLESLFELCRYPLVLAQAPVGKACAYKEMGRCPAPCDGSISMEMYRQMAERAAVCAGRPALELIESRNRMLAAAAATRFESAGKIKQYVAEMSELEKPAFRWLGQIEDFQFLGVGGTRVEGWFRLIIVTGGDVLPLASVRIDVGPSPAAGRRKRFVPATGLHEALSVVAELTAGRAPRPTTVAETEHMGLVSQSLFSPRSDVVFIRSEDISESAVVLAAKEVASRARRAEADAKPDRAGDTTEVLPSTLPGLGTGGWPGRAENRPERELTDMGTDVPE